MSGSARTRSEQSCNARVLRTNESNCNRPEDSDGLSHTHSGRVSAARRARDQHSTLARHGLLVSMHAIEILCLPPSNLSGQMEAMRTWLDEHHFEEDGRQDDRHFCPV